MSVEAIRQHRGALTEQHAALAAKVQKLNSAKADQASAKAALDDLSAEELHAMQQWLADQSDRPAPQPDMEQRARLLRLLGAAIQNETVIQAAAADLAIEFDGVNRDLAAINDQLDTAALDEITDDFAAAMNDLIAFAVTAQSKVAAVYGAVDFLRSERETSMSSGNTTRATAIMRRLERMALMSKPQWNATVAETQAAAPAWRARFAEMMK